LDVAAQRAIEQIAHAVDLAAQIERLGLQRLAPCKGQQLAAQRGTPFGSLAHSRDDALATLRIGASLDQAQPRR